MYNKLFYFIFTILLIFISCNRENEYGRYRNSKSLVIAHAGGVWNYDGGVENSIESLNKAISLNVDGIEFDVCKTKDDSLVVIHGPLHDNVNIAHCNYSDLSKHRLLNGERIPDFTDFLSILKKHADVKVFIDLKFTDRIDIVCKQIDNFNLDNEIFFLTFDFDVSRSLILLNSNHNVIYLNHDKSLRELSENGLRGVGFNKNLLDKTSDLLKIAKKLNLQTAIWTIENESDIVICSNSLFDYIITDIPEVFQSR